MSTNTFTPAEFATFASTPGEARQKAKAVPYTGVGVVYYKSPARDEYEIVVVEAVDKSTMLTALQGATAATNLSVDTATQSFVANGVASVTFNLTGAVNKVVNLLFGHPLQIDKASVTLDGAGAGAFTVGPYAAGWLTDLVGVKIDCQYADECADGVECTVKIT